MTRKSELDEIGPWSEIKLEIIREYASAYSRILAAQKSPRLFHVYIDAFAGAGVHVSRTSGSFVRGSPLNALLIEPPFRAYHLIDIETDKVASLRKVTAGRQDVKIYEGDCNPILLNEVFPKIKYEDYRRGLCLLDPYGLHLHWKVIEAAGRMKSLEIFLNFPIADINRNALLRDPDAAKPEHIRRMNAYWGDDSWRTIAYSKKRNLFGEYLEKESNEAIAEAFQKRLRKVAGFGWVPEPIPMKNSRGAVVYYLFFASQKPVAAQIVKDIFTKYRQF
ncbi:MAG TPA: three-Cys-motif partner protein TcmP [Acidobacteriota bacterium]|jgi:three-Cys-motif partner protein